MIDVPDIPTWNPTPIIMPTYNEPTMPAGYEAKGQIIGRTSPTTARPGETINVSAAVKNTGWDNGNFALVLMRGTYEVRRVNVGQVNALQTSGVKTMSVTAPTGVASVTYTLECRQI